jgi:hypothetical protein
MCPFGDYGCPSSANATCSVGYMGVLCGVCNFGYHNLNGQCSPCTGTSKAMLPILIVGVAFFVGVVVWVARKFDPVTIQNIITVLQILIGYMQVTASSNSACYEPPPLPSFFLTPWLLCPNNISFNQ